MRTSAFISLVAVSLSTTLLCQAQITAMPASTASRILEQATWGPTEQSVRELQAKGFDQWFTDQVNAPISTYPNQPMLGSDGKPFRDISGVQVQFFQNALNKPDQLRQRLAFALSEIWVVSHVGVVTRAAYFPPLLNLFQRDAFEHYSKLMKDITLNPAMGAYLDMLNNRKATATTAPNENYGRELMQLFTLGLNNLELDGSQARDSKGKLIPTYSPATVTAISAALTGWVYAAPRAGDVRPNILDPMVPNDREHDEKEKLISFAYPDGRTVTFTLPPNQSAEDDLDGALAAISAHPTLPPFVCKQLIQHLVTSNPSPAYVERVGTVFKETEGDLKQVVRAILTDTEARRGDNQNGAEDNSFGHFREPVLLMENLLRGLNGSVAQDSKLNNYTANLGQNLFSEPSVFSYFSPQYALSQNLLAPELQLHTTQTAVYRANYIDSIVYRGKLDAGTTFDISEFVRAAQVPPPFGRDSLQCLISDRFFHGDMPYAVQAAIEESMQGAANPADKAKAALYIALTSSKFQVMN